MAPATPPRSRNRRGKSVVMDAPARPELFPTSPQRQPQLGIPVTPGSVGTKPNMSHFNRLRSPLLRSPAKGLRTPEYTPVKPSESVKKKLDFGDASHEFQSVGRVLFPESTESTEISDRDRFQNRFLAPPSSTATSQLLQGAPQLLPSNSQKQASKAFSSLLQDQLDEEDSALSSVRADPWEPESAGQPARKEARQMPGTPSDKIVTFELAKDWNNNSRSCFSSDEEGEEPMVRQKTLANPFDDNSTASEETRRRRQELLIAENPSIGNTIQYVDKNGKLAKERRLSPEEQKRFQPRRLFTKELDKD
ncbi:LADA_0C12068g1_1 [Lachancea dasiensis]|uniref:LADA_0C12068g1_1 n=1 Tax=Lachancea dasiensis TaxID=1072105 RepID=A0A1G4J1M1_9SACH|nr:LADA_0C12068g1_1 [Lachancea dasiensis]